MDTLIFAIISVITFGCSIGAFIKVISTYNKYKKIDNQSGLSGCEVALKILANNGLDKIYVVEVKGTLEDHYDVSRNVIRLSSHVFHDSSIASMVIASHVTALAIIKNKQKPFLLKIKGLLSQTVTIITYLSYLGLLLALASRSMRYLQLAIGVMFIIVLYHLIMYKLESDASIRGSLELKKLQLVKKSELDDIKIVSNSMRFLDIASVITSIFSLFNKLLKK